MPLSSVNQGQMNDRLNDSSGFRGDISVKIARQRETAQYNAAKLSQPRPIMAAPMHRDTAREEVVTRQTEKWTSDVVYRLTGYNTPT